MECSKQGYWSIEYREVSNFLVDSTANNNYSRFAKRQFHKARRRFDKEIIQQQLEDIIEEHKMYCQIFDDMDNYYKFAKI